MYNTYKESWKTRWLLKNSFVERFSNKKEASNGDLKKAALIRGFFAIKRSQKNLTPFNICLQYDDNYV